jgi:hypothetical protein
MFGLVGVSMNLWSQFLLFLLFQGKGEMETFWLLEMTAVGEQIPSNGVVPEAATSTEI